MNPLGIPQLKALQGVNFQQVATAWYELARLGSVFKGHCEPFHQGQIIQTVLVGINDSVVGANLSWYGLPGMQCLF